MSPERAGEMPAVYGGDAMFLPGGSLLRHGARIGAAIVDLRATLAAFPPDQFSPVTGPATGQGHPPPSGPGGRG